MSTAALDYESAVGGDESHQYRAMHTGALIGLVLGILSVFVVVAAANTLDGCLLVTPIPVLGIFMSIRALTRIRQQPEAYTGRTIAVIGLVLSLVFLVGGIAYGGYVYATEVPEGYTRISFNGMKPDEVQERGGVIVRPEIAELNGKRVFIKGYMRPDSVTMTRGIGRFLLVRDNNQCCFGDLSKIKYYDQIDVTMAGSQTVDFSQGVFRMGGILTIQPENAVPGARNPVYSLKADYAE